MNENTHKEILDAFELNREAIRLVLEPGHARNKVEMENEIFLSRVLRIVTVEEERRAA